MTSKTIKCQIWSRSTKGGRPDHENEDSLGLLLPGLPSKETIEDLDGGNVFALGKDGVVMVVADGMGGLNAGEVASHIAVDVVKQAFEKKNAEIDSLSRNGERRRIFLEGIIREADRAIREHSANNVECSNMGSTLVIAWLVGQKLTVSWCGDSRAYILHGGQLEMVTHDHSYVQELVDKGELDYEASFSHPDNNIVTHCLGATEESSVKADSRTIDVEKDDIILLCSDGVSGVLFDDARFYKGKPLSSENLQDTLVRNGADAKAAVNEIFAATERCGWHDNATAIVCRIADGPLPPRIACQWLRHYWWVLIASMALVFSLVFFFENNKKKYGTQTTNTQSETPPQDITEGTTVAQGTDIGSAEMTDKVNTGEGKIETFAASTNVVERPPLNASGIPEQTIQNTSSLKKFSRENKPETSTTNNY